WFETIVFKLLAKEPADRFDSAADVAELLGQRLRWLQDPDAPPPTAVSEPARPRRSDAAASGRERASGPGKRNRGTSIVVACVFGVILVCAGLPAFGLLGVALFRVSSDSPPPMPPVRGVPKMTAPAFGAMKRDKGPPRDGNVKHDLIGSLTDPSAP